MSIANVVGLGPGFLRREALALGLTDTMLRRAMAKGELVRPRQGLYVDGLWWSKANPESRHREVARAAVRLFAQPVVMSHWTAALLHGLPVWNVDLRRVHVTHLAPASGRLQGDIVHHRSRRELTGNEEVDNVPVTGVARTVIDCAKLGGVERGMVVADGALAKGLVTPRCLVEQAVAQDHDPHSLPVRLVVGGATALAQSAGETRSRLLFSRAGLPTPQLQYKVYDAFGKLLGIVDFAWPEHGVIVEFDGKVKYVNFVPEGKTALDVLMEEKQREDRIREATGWTVIRLTWDDLNHPDRTAARIRRAMRRRSDAPA